MSDLNEPINLKDAEISILRRERQELLVRVATLRGYVRGNLEHLRRGNRPLETDELEAAVDRLEEVLEETSIDRYVK